MIYLNSQFDKVSIAYDDGDIPIISGNTCTTMDQYNERNRKAGYVITKPPLYPVIDPEEETINPIKTYDQYMDWLSKKIR